MPIHLRAEPGDYAPAVLLPGDPLRAKRVAEEFLDDARQVNGERGMLGFTGTHQGTPVSVQATGMGCPSAAIVIEELIQLGAERLIRIGTCGGLQPGLGLGETIIALSAVPGDATALRYTQGEPHAPTAHFGLTHGAIHAAKGLGIRPHVGAIASSDTFYDPDPGRHHRWAERGVLAVEMEAAVLFTIGALRGVKTACILTVSDLVTGDAPVRIADDDLVKGVERMTLLALAAAIDPKA
ncbi:MAG: purine-nucleoside phosphorylase [Gaiellales bacterium]|jgi:DeoD family purine-nucleoside phosphorylase|nr:purine-nucleoside phosphorylase [Gaiellales bacterium]MDX6592184.1 purine-nucleoside phosphorylase [Gaiellales bacterium]